MTAISMVQCLFKSVCPAMRRHFGLTAVVRGRMDRREHQIGSKPVEEGVEGEKYFETIDLKSSGSTFPTMETMKQVFHGIPFDETPICYVKCSKNNVKISITDCYGAKLMYTSCGLEGFKNCKKKTEVAGQATGIAAGMKALRRGIKSVRMIVSGLGPGRMSSVRELGPRPRKKRRI
uniref:28S ribosomal protein S11, mitochondrial n=1 Tax=Trichuris muris TaxID=70415 RepID=A0A5S6Q8S4_TRIMR